jgi:hypothetical protein
MRSWVLLILIGFLGCIYFHPYQFYELINFAKINLVFGDELDARFVTYILEHLFQVLQLKAELLSPAMFYPTKNTLGYSDILLGLEIPYALFRILGASPLYSLILSIIACNYLVYLATTIVMWRGLGVKFIPSIAGALFFSFNSAKFNQLNHLQLQPLFLLPILLWIIYVVLNKAKTASWQNLSIYLIFGVVVFQLQLLTAYYSAWYFFFWFIIFLLFGLFIKPLRESIFCLLFKKYHSLLISSFVGIVTLIPFFLIYYPILRQKGWRPFAEVEGMIPRPLSFLWMGEGHPWWGFIKDILPIYQLHFHWEHRIGIGLIAMLTIAIFFILTVIKIIKNKDKSFNVAIAITFMTSSIIFLLLGISIGGFTFWSYIYEYVLGAKGIRAVSRYVLIILLPITTAIVMLISAKPKIGTSLSSILTLLFFLIMVEQGGGRAEGFERQSFEVRLSEVIKELKNKNCNSFYITAPPESKRWHMAYNTDAILISISTGIPTLNGYSGQEPEGWALGNVLGADYLSNLKNWIERNKLTAVCSVEM